MFSPLSQQRGNDEISGGEGSDILVGDSARMAASYDTELPVVVEVFRALGVHDAATQGHSGSAGVAPLGGDEHSFGFLFHAPQRLMPAEVSKKKKNSPHFFIRLAVTTNANVSPVLGIMCMSSIAHLTAPE